MKKVLILGAMVCALGMMNSCKSGISTEKIADSVANINEDFVELNQPANSIFSEGNIFFVDRNGNIISKGYDDADAMPEGTFAFRNDSVFQIDSLGNEKFQYTTK